MGRPTLKPLDLSKATKPMLNNEANQGRIPEKIKLMQEIE